MESSIADFTYGDHERQVLGIGPAASASPTPLISSIHGGGSTRGGKRSGYHQRLEQLLAVWIPVAAINYRLVGQLPLPAARCDAARAIQTLRP